MDPKTYITQINSSFNSIEQVMAQFPSTIIDETDQKNFEQREYAVCQLQSSRQRYHGCCQRKKAADEIKLMLRQSKTVTSEATDGLQNHDVLQVDFGFRQGQN